MTCRSLYIHVPFCQGGKCDYCAFYSIPDAETALHRRYLERLEAELAANAAQCEPLRSVFIGGGTPSALGADDLARLCSAVKANFTLLPDCEWSSEANPESLTPEKLAVLRAGGVNRISLGIQSFQETRRRLIGRRGDLARLPELVTEIRRMGFTALNFDLIYAIPGETPAAWAEELRRALEFRPEHLSCYSLIRESGTPLARRLTAEADEELFLSCWRLNDEILGGAGLQRYEISNFAAENRQCRHNFEIWHGQTYLGCGPAAVSFDGVDRPANPADLDAWLAGAAPEHDLLPAAARRRELLAFGFRTVQGWQWQELQAVTGFSREQLLEIPAIQQLIESGWLTQDDAGIRATPDGLLCNDLILEALLA